MFFTVGECSETCQRMNARFFYHGHKIARAWVVPAQKSRAGALGISNGVFGELRVGDEPSFVNARRCIVCITQIFISRMHIQCVFDVCLATRLVVEFRLYAYAPSVFFGYNIDLVRRAAPSERYPRSSAPSM